MAHERNINNWIVIVVRHPRETTAFEYLYGGLSWSRWWTIYIKNQYLHKLQCIRNLDKSYIDLKFCLVLFSASLSSDDRGPRKIENWSLYSKLQEYLTPKQVTFRICCFKCRSRMRAAPSLLIFFVSFEKYFCWSWFDLLEGKVDLIDAVIVSFFFFSTRQRKWNRKYKAPCYL